MAPAVESVVNGDSKSTNEGVLPWLIRWACRAGTRDFCPALPTVVRPYKIFFTLLGACLKIIEGTNQRGTRLPDIFKSSNIFIGREFKQ